MLSIAENHRLKQTEADSKAALTAIEEIRARLTEIERVMTQPAPRKTLSIKNG